MPSDDRSARDYLWLLAYVGFPLALVFVGPLEALAGLALYWLVSSDEGAETTAE